LLGFVDKCIATAKKLDSKYITWPWLDPKLRTLDNFKLMAQKLNLIGKYISESGLGFAYHNHGFEFEDYQGLMMHSSKYTPSELINLQPGRFTMWHIKDMDKVTRDYTELGNGSIDYKKLLPDPKKSGLEYFEYYFIEQGGNYAVDSTTSAIESAKYFKSDLQELLR